MNDSKFSHEEQAKKLQAHLADASTRHEDAVKPFEETADALKREASVDGAKLDSGVARIQRHMLMELAKKHKETPASEPVKEKNSLTQRRPSPWLAWLGGAVTVVAVFFAAVIVQNFNPNKGANLPGGSTNVAAVARLVIPEASAADAFTLIAENQDSSGADPATSFLVKSAIPLTSEEMRNHVRIVPAADTSAVPVDVTVDLVSDGQFRVRPVEPLTPGAVYKVGVETAVKKDNGELQARDFTWAIQTKNIFRVLSSVPAPNANYVPVNTGIEFVMSMPNWEDPKANFSITPNVDGRFEAHGRSLVFVPSKPLAPGQLYVATLKKGLKVKNSDRELEQDMVLRFETATGSGMPNNTWSVSLQQPFMTVAPGKDLLVPFWINNSYTQIPEITVTGYSLSMDEAKKVIEEEGKVPGFAEATRSRGEAFKSAAKNQAFQVKATVEKHNYQDFLHIPGQTEGRYVVKVEPKDQNASWFFLQVTKVATYVISDKDTTVIWAMNAETGRPLENLSITSNSNSAKTDNSGLGRLPTPAQLTSTSTDGVAIFTVGEGNMSALIRVLGGSWNIWNRWMPVTDDKTISYMMVDRPLYHPTDSLHIFGKAIDRDAKNPAGNLTIELQRSGFIDWFSTGKEKVYRSTGLQPDDQGVFRGDLSWNNLAPGYYQIILKRNGEVIRSRSIEVRDFVKPAYRIEVTPEKNSVFSGESVKVQVRASFYDGTPVSNLEVNLDAYGPSTANGLRAKTDADGLASFTLPTQMNPCAADAGSYSSYCEASTALQVTVRPVDAENAEISGTSYIGVWRARVNLESSTKVSGDVATVTVKARTVDLAKAQTDAHSRDVLGEPKRGLNITGRVYELTWERRETGNVYDFIEKKIVPTYSYTQKSREIAPINVTTDSEGNASINVPMRADVSYRAVFFAKDERGAEQREVASFAREGYYDGYPGNSSDITFDVSAADRNQTGYDVGKTVSFELTRNNTRLADTAAPNYLFIKAQRGLKEVKPSTSAVYRLNFSEADVPNVALRAVVFLNGGFIERQNSATFNNASRELKVTLTTDAKNYAPGGVSKVHVKAVDKNGKPASDGRLAISVVDEALFDAAGGSGEEFPLADLYGWVSDGILAAQESHLADAAEATRIGGAEFGGGGMGEAIRRDFKDTASFQVITLNGNGEGDIEVKLPDNLTSWRATAVAIGNDLTAGYSRSPIIVTKPVFVEAVVPSVLLTNDKPVLKLRAYGTGLTAGTKITYNIDAPTLGLKQDFDGVVGTPTYIAIDKLTSGEHAMVLRVKSDKGLDALEKKVRIVSSRFLRQEMVQADLAPGSSLPDIGQSREIDLTIIPKTRAQYLSYTQMLAEGWSQRAESKIAANIARDLLKNQFAAKGVGDRESLTRYQKSTGGIAILPYASEDVELSSKVASLAPDQFDRAALGQYFYNILKKPDATREQQIRAVSGLAALGEPMLPELRALGEEKNLAWREQLALARGAVAAGDQDLAKAMLAPFFARMEERDGQSFIRVSEDKREQIEATAEMAVIAARLNIPQAARLDAWLQNNWAQDAFTDLDRIAYLEVVVPAAIGRDVSLSYTLGGGEQRVVLKDGMSELLTLTAEEAKAFRTVSIDGPAVAVFTRQTPALPASSKDLSLTRTLSAADGKPASVLKEGDAVTITLEPKFSPSAPSGCYLLRDHAPAGLAPMVSLSFAEYREIGYWYPQQVDGNTVSFTVCNAQDGKPVTPIKYHLRVVARGTYTAEPAILQSDSAPSVSVTTPAQTVEIK